MMTWKASGLESGFLSEHREHGGGKEGETGRTGETGDDQHPFFEVIVQYAGIS